jgi:hypothetical protein
MNISFEAPYYYFIQNEGIKSIEIYNKFLNWIKGEFDLYQIDELDGLKVYYPNGWFTIKIINQNAGIINIEISVKSKVKESGFKTYQKIEALYTHLIKCFS